VALLSAHGRDGGQSCEVTRRATKQDIKTVKLKLKSGRPPTREKLWAMEEKFPAVRGPSPSSYAARHGLKLSKNYMEHLARRQANGNGKHSVSRRRKPALA
jgi:hypothetical protein